jgi:hypothetical protein
MSEAILNEMLTRLSAITIAGGYNTDMGDSASIAQRQYNTDEITADGAVNVYDTGDSNEDDESMGSEYLLRLDLSVEGHIRIGDNSAVTLANKLQKDIKKAVLLTSDRIMGGLVLDVRYTGREVEYPDAAGDVVSVKLNFYVLFMETYGSP